MNFLFVFPRGWEEEALIFQGWDSANRDGRRMRFASGKGPVCTP